MMAEVSNRLRRAIISNDVPLLQRLLAAHPTSLQNPEYLNQSNTSLHLAAKHGLFDIAEVLIAKGHDASSASGSEGFDDTDKAHGISYNVHGQTPLHLAAANLQTSLAELLCQKFPSCINKADKDGATPLLLAAKAQSRKTLSITPPSKLKPRAAEETSTVEVLLEHGADVGAQDLNGNTCLHNACAWGNLKTVRILIEAGADPLCSNYAGWTPEYYSLTVQAEVYYKNLVTELETKKVEVRKLARQRRAQLGGSVRLVSEEDDDIDDNGNNAEDDDDGDDEDDIEDDDERVIYGDNDLGLRISAANASSG